MHLPLLIARRYLFAKKSHNVINIISLISAVGIAVGTCALIIVLSIYNGFEDIVKEVYERAEADLVISPVKGKSFSPNSELFDQIRGYSHTALVSEVVQDNVFVTYDGAQEIALIKGVDSTYHSNEMIKSCLLDGEFQLYHGEVAQAVIGRTLAQNMRIRTYSLDPLEVYFPARGREVSMTNPLASLNKEILFAVGIISVGQELDKQIIYLPIESARRLLDYTDQVSSLEIRIDNPANVENARKYFASLLGDDYSVKDKYMQNETVYKMMTYEKMAIFMILLFIIIIISCNVFGSLTMLIIEKKDDIWTLKGIGANDRMVKRIFVEEGWLITLYGVLVGVGLGVALCLIQYYFGVIKMPGNFIVTSYPVVIKFTDILLTVVGVGLVGFIISLIPIWRTLPAIYKEFQTYEV